MDRTQQSDSYAMLAAYTDLPFYSKQIRIVLRNCGIIDPERIEAYFARDGYQGSARR